jgi:dTDP-4-dehydrorhamnose 3,5-epimerase
MEGVNVFPLKIIKTPNGEVKHALKSSDDSFSGFGEAYFSSVDFGAIKGWKKHTQMTLNLIVPVGEIKFTIFDDREGSDSFGKYFSIILGVGNYQRLSISPNLWVAFEGIGKGENTLLNIASIEHNPDEAVNMDLNNTVFTYPR